MISLLDFIFRNFWTWAGTMALVYILTNFIVNIINIWFYHRTIRKIGYPPAHCVGQPGTGAIKEEVPKLNE